MTIVEHTEPDEVIARTLFEEQSVYIRWKGKGIRGINTWPLFHLVDDIETAHKLVKMARRLALRDGWEPSSSMVDAIP